MKPRTVYEKAVQDFTETARRLARLNQHFRQASFAEFEMLMGLDDEVLRRYGLPKQMIEQALREAYQTVVLDQERSTGANYI
jgi:multidrug efflux pump subunit AcrB